MDVCVGGGARPLPPPEDAGDREEGGPRLGAGPRARWAELAAGNWPSVGGRGPCASRGTGGGGIMDDTEDGEGTLGGRDVAVGRGGGGIESVADSEKVGGGGGMLPCA